MTVGLDTVVQPRLAAEPPDILTPVLTVLDDDRLVVRGLPDSPRGCICLR